MTLRPVRFCDLCGKEILENGGAKIRVTAFDARRSSLEGDACDACVTERFETVLRTVGRRGRKPKK